MNFTSASVNRIPARSEASAAEISRLGSPGAPGCTIGVCAWLPVAPSDMNARLTTMVAADSGQEYFWRLMGSSPRTWVGVWLRSHIVPHHILNIGEAAVGGKTLGDELPVPAKSG